LPPHFQEGVWRRIESTDWDASADNFPWLEVLLQRLLRPRLALAAVTVLVLLGGVLGLREGADSARQADQARYLEAVAHGVLQ